MLHHIKMSYNATSIECGLEAHHSTRCADWQQLSYCQARPACVQRTDMHANIAGLLSSSSCMQCMQAVNMSSRAQLAPACACLMRCMPSPSMLPISDMRSNRSSAVSYISLGSDMRGVSDAINMLAEGKLAYASLLLNAMPGPDPCEDTEAVRLCMAKVLAIQHQRSEHLSPKHKV